MITHLRIFATLPECFYYWVYSTKSFCPSFKNIILRAPNCSIVGCSCILKMVRHYYHQNIWCFEFVENYHFQFYFLAARFHEHLLEQWPSGQGAVAPRSTQPFILPRSVKWVPEISGNLVVISKLPPRSGASLEAVEPHP